MKLEQLEAFVLAAEAASLAGAGRQLDRSRTSISLAISSLEDELGLSLFERSGNRVVLTEAGRALLPDCQRMLQLAQQLTTRARQWSQGQEMEIRIARDDALPEAQWARIMASLKAQAPNTRVTMVLAPPQELVEMVAQGAVDLAFGLNLNRHLGVQVEELGRVRMQRVVASHHPLASQRPVTDADLFRSTQLLLSYWKADRVAVAPRESADHVAMSSFEQLRDLVEQGIGWAWLPAPLVRARLRQETFRVLRHPHSSELQPYQAAYLMEGGPGPISQAWIEAVFDTLQQDD
ncbi:LysR family transcriptional regulator [Ferrimonas marina]|uniref:DNA-binding transcriptional regulator, LysR family n=1 Tax=Ferrimonas marina TaxID=299255 RepID=A0A1M5VGN9_9GAMM|nr:LysR family transcriptional regulator [Ferrimonas marina]SHH74419.1 DNA-binding transcriptional regulator, LysR family [Ferrimonas marina]